MKVAPFFSARAAISFETLGSIVLLSSNNDPGFTVLHGLINLGLFYHPLQVSVSNITLRFHFPLHMLLVHDCC